MRDTRVQLNSTTGPQHEAPFVEMLRHGLTRLKSELDACSFLKTPVWNWVESLGRGAGPDAYFLHRYATPVFLVPWWFERALTGGVDLEFHSQVGYATINLCYYVRLLDDAVDGHKDTAHLLCALSFFHSRYQGAYIPLFPAEHPFWGHFYALNDRACDITAHDSALKDVTLADFKTITARKSCAALVALAAIAGRYNRLDAFEEWSRFWYAFGRWNQMRDDFFDWQADQRSGIDTLILSEAKRRKKAGEETVAWLIREGFDWAADTLRVFGREALEAAEDLESPELEGYVRSRIEEGEAQLSGLTRALAAISAPAR